MAAIAAVRLEATQQWSRKEFGHASILNKFKISPENTDYTIPRLNFEKNFLVTIPSRSRWEDDAFLEDESIHFYTDGSKTKDGVGAGVFSDRLNLKLSFRLPNHCSVFQAEIMAIKEALSWLKKNVISARDIRIFSDSQAAIKSLESTSINSLVALDCRSSLVEMAEQFNIHLCWVPGHRDIPGNCKADELAKEGTTLPILPDNGTLGIPIATRKLKLKLDAIESANLRWTSGSTCLATKQIWPKLDLKRSKNLISLNRLHIGTTIGVITGHCLIGKHATRLGLFANDFCRSCMDEEEEETIPHLLCFCPALSRRRKLHLGAPYYNDIGDLMNIDIKSLLRFIRSSNWF